MSNLSTSISRSVQILRDGGVIALPTDTLYGISANALDPEAAAKVFSVKDRGERSPLPIFVSDTGDLYKYGRDIPDTAVRLAEIFWPGKLTIVVGKSDLVPDVVSGGIDTVGLRIPDHPAPRGIVAQLGAPITATSANVSGKPALTAAEDVVAELGSRLDLVLDGGNLAPSAPSTVIDVTADPPRILRQGALSASDIQKLAGIDLEV
ncbi:MAG: threonylcarbamoyl-AMP synthase [Dehalococcoidia bacterium]|nr:threonylcarbamoyl-AMP synthase [Dehalococcoidia bacterium]